jgi:DNA-binding NtrC family response regulator
MQTVVTRKLIGQSGQMSHLRKTIEKLSQSKVAVLIEGETGSGKALVAEALHDSAAGGSFVAVNCCANSPAHEPDWISAISGNRGNIGTMFLDEVGDLSQEGQAFLLRAFQERGRASAAAQKSAPRIVSAGRCELLRFVRKGHFLADLYYHLSTVTLRTPALREHKEDIRALVDYYLQGGGKDELLGMGLLRAGQRFTLSKECLHALVSYDWPGNVRELRNALERMIALADGQILQVDHLPQDVLRGRQRPLASAKTRAFLCHSSEDKEQVRALYRRLVEKGVAPWLDEIDLLPGHDWRLEITQAVRSSHVIVVYLSRNSVRKDGFVQKEIAMALDLADEKPEGSIFIIPVKLEPCDVPQRLRRWQWVEMFHEAGFEKLLSAVQTVPSRLDANERPSP